MSKKFYKILGLTDKASDTEILEAYREIALKLHPLNKKTGNLAGFHKLSEAFEVLSDSKLRRNYDRLDELVFKEGVPQDAAINNNFVAGYSYRGDGFEIFQRFFGSSNPFFSDFSESFGLKKFKDQMPERKQSIIVSDLIVEVPCSLEELFHGCQRTLVFQRNVINADGSYRTEPGAKVIEIQPGSGEFSEIVFEGEGHEGVNRIKTDLKVKIIETKHEVFIRKDHDLIMIKKIPLVNAITAEALQVNTLDNRIVTISFDEIISPRTRKIVIGEGMPILNTGKKGKLIIKFFVEFPKYLTQEQKDELVEVLS